MKYSNICELKTVTAHLRTSIAQEKTDFSSVRRSQIPQGYVRQEPGVGLAIKCDVHKGLRSKEPRRLPQHTLRHMLVKGTANPVYLV
jgi:hypothetical protein